MSDLKVLGKKPQRLAVRPVVPSTARALDDLRSIVAQQISHAKTVSREGLMDPKAINSLKALADIIQSVEKQSDEEFKRSSELFDSLTGEEQLALEAEARKLLDK